MVHIGISNVLWYNFFPVFKVPFLAWKLNHFAMSLKVKIIPFLNNEIVIFFSPGSVLWSLPWSGVWIKFFNDWRLFFHSVCSCAWTGHCWAEKNVDDQHDKEQNPESDAQIEQPGWAHPNTVRANWLGIWKDKKSSKCAIWQMAWSSPYLGPARSKKWTRKFD